MDGISENYVSLLKFNKDKSSGYIYSIILQRILPYLTRNKDTIFFQILEILFTKICFSHLPQQNRTILSKNFRLSKL